MQNRVLEPVMDVPLPPHQAGRGVHRESVHCEAASSS